jgi:hypothetical protein
MRKIQFVFALIAMLAVSAGVFASISARDTNVVIPAIDSDNDGDCDLQVPVDCEAPSGEECTFEFNGSERPVGEQNLTAPCNTLYKTIP